MHKRQTQSHLLPQGKDGRHQQLSCSSSAAGAAAGPGETSRCGRELGGRVLVSRESAGDEKFAFQDASSQEKQDSLVWCLQVTF